MVWDDLNLPDDGGEIESPLYLTENLLGDQRLPVLWHWHVGLLSQKKKKKKETITFLFFFFLFLFSLFFFPHSSVFFFYIAPRCGDELPLLTRGHFTHEPRAVTVKLWEPKRKCSKAVPTRLPNHVVWSRTLECSVKSYVTRPSTKRYFNELLFTQVLTHDKTEYIHGCERSGCHGLPVYVRPIPKTWFLQTIQVTMKHDPFDAT